MLRQAPNLSVRQLAEFVCRSGDLYAQRTSRPVEPEAGLRAQQHIQRGRREQHETYQHEVGVLCEFDLAGASRSLRGRIDGCYRHASGWVVEEFKCVATPPDQPDAVDWGQALIYAAMWSHQQNLDAYIDIHLIYIEAETLREHPFRQRVSTAAAQAWLALMLLCVAVRWRRHCWSVMRRETFSAALSFPLPQFRRGQQALARRVYQAVRDRENLLLEAPTGSGKSLGVLFPAVKSLRNHQQLFFLTARNSGAQAALLAARQLSSRGLLKVVEITAKEKICPVEGMPCDASRCEYAAGYFDRIGGVVDLALQAGTVDRELVEQLAQTHRVCPFELSLDVASWADVVIGDYNYVFDPQVRLQRFAQHKDLHLLVDEAHQLGPRVAAMLSCELSRATLSAALPELPEHLVKRVKSIDRALMALKRHYATQPTDEVVCADVGAVDRAVARFLEALQDSDLILREAVVVQALWFDCSRWNKSSQWLDDHGYAHILVCQDRHVRLRRTCLDPAKHIRDCMAQHGAAVRFSATVSPLSLYQQLHGQQGSIARAQSPFSPHQLSLNIVTDVPTFYRQRSNSLPRLARLIQQVVQARRGRYLVALPSYAYLSQLAAELDEQLPVFAQSRDLSPTESLDLLKRFAEHEQGVALVVMGGRLTESVDFAQMCLSGVVLVGLGLPPPSVERTLMVQHYNELELDGEMIAYLQPAMVKIVQAAGRLLRSPEDRGVIVLVDPRFANAQIQQFFPRHWCPQTTTMSGLTQSLTHFWHAATP